MDSYNLTGDPYSSTYVALLSHLLRTQHTFSLVWRNDTSFEQSALDLQASLRAFEVERCTTDSWPGTQLFGGTALVIRYRCSPFVVGHLTTPGSLFRWLAPAFPEDLAFYDSNGECSFASISHERDAWTNDRDLASDLVEILPVHPDPRK